MIPQEDDVAAQAGRDDEPRSSVSELAEAVVDGVDIDWPAVESSSLPDDLPVVKALREVETVLGAHREVLAEASPARRRPPPLHAGDRWGHLEICGYLGGGGFGDVYEAFDPRIERSSALKILDAPEASDEALLREARLLAKMNHPNVVKVYGADRLDGRVGISMELLDGHTLSDELDQFGPMSADDAVVIGMKLCDALAEVHRQGIVHRDVKAQNVMRAHGGRVVLMDFGIGFDAGAGESARPAGTPAYQAPELLAGGAPGIATDVYALGVLLFHLVTVNFPVRGTSMKEFRRRHEAGDVAHLRDLRPGLPEAFVRVVEKALEPDPALRFRSAGAFHRALSRAMESSVLAGRTARPARGWRRLARNTVAYGLVWAAIFGALWWFFWPRPPEEPARVLLGQIDDQALDAAFHGTLDASLRSSFRDSPAFELVSLTEEREVSLRMRRDGPAGFSLEGELREAAVRTAAPAVAMGEILKIGEGWELAVWISPVLDLEARRVVHRTIPKLTTAALESAANEMVVELERDTRDWRSSEGLLRATSLPVLERATTDSLAALEQYTEGLQAYQRGAIELSESKLRSAIQEDPRFALAHLHLGHALSARGDQENALEQFERAFEFRGNTASDRERLTIEAAYRAVFRQYVPAIEAYRQLLDRVESDPSARRQLAIAHLELGQHDEAIANARLGRQDPLNHGLLVYVLAVAGRPEEALAEAESIRTEFGGSRYMLWSEGFSLLILERMEEALGRTRELDDGMGGVYRNLASWLEARIHLYSGDLSTALEMLYRDRSTDAVEGADFLEIRRRYWTARIQALRGQRSNALGVLRNLDLPTIPAHQRSWRSVAVLQAELGDLEGAEATLGRLETLHGEHPSLISAMLTAQARAEISLARGEAETAVELLRRNSGLADVSFVRTAARVFAAVGELEEAAFLDERLLERKGEVLDKEFVGFWVEAHVRRARVLGALGRDVEAAEHWHQARRLWSDLADEAFGPGAPADALPWVRD